MKEKTYVLKQEKIKRLLTARRMEELSKARNEHGLKNLWTIDGKILFKENGSNKVKLSYGLVE